MHYLRKLKPDRSILGFLPALVSLVGFSFFTIFWGFHAGAGFLFFVFFGFALISLNIFRKTRNSGFLMIMMFQIFCALYLACIPGGLFRCSSDRYFKFFTVCMLFFAVLITHEILTVNRLFKKFLILWHGCCYIQKSNSQWALHVY